MNTVAGRLLSTAIFCITSSFALAQSAQAPGSTVTARSIKAIGYQVGGGSTTVDLVGTTLDAGATGEANVEAKPAVTNVEASVKGLKPSTQLGAEFLAYVMWAVSPEGRAVNLGELRVNANGQGALKTTTQLQGFSLFVTAEPYPSVRQPSEMVMLENEARKNTKGRVFVVSDYQLMKRSQYQKLANPLALSVDLKQAPLEMYQARNAVEIAKLRGAEKYAPEVFSKAQGALEAAEQALVKKGSKKDIISLARSAMQTSEDARAVTAERVEAERIANERAAAAAQAKAAAEAKAAADAAVAKARADADARQQAEIAAAREAQLKAEAAARQAEAARQEAQLRADNAAKEAASREALIRAETEAAAREAQIKGEAERARLAAAALRTQLLDQFNRILETHDSERGLVITMSDVLFDTGKYELRPPTREALARLSGIVASHPGLKLDVEGHTDSTGSDELNQKLSEQRAAAVREYLIQQRLADGSITARGLGKTVPVADNTTAAGRQKNRRVELIVSGEVIGVKIGN